MQRTKVYWEKQGADRLCALHCLNSVLQGPFFDEVSLANIALYLDRKYHELMIEQGQTKYFLKFMQEDSGNVAMDEALKTLGLFLETITMSEEQYLAKKTRFICNSSEHWFAIAKVDNVWYNLNSTNKRMPEIVSDFYLSAFLVSIKEFGYQIFSVYGQMPKSNENMFEHYNKHQKWYDSLRIKKYSEKCQKRKGYLPNISGAAFDDDVYKAIAASLGRKYEKYISSGYDSNWYSEYVKYSKPFYGKAHTMHSKFKVDYHNFNLDPHDVEMIQFLKQSLLDEFKHEPIYGSKVVFRLGNGAKVTRVFGQEETIETLYNYIWAKYNNKFYLTNAKTKHVLDDLTIPIFALEDEGLVNIFVNYL